MNKRKCYLSISLVLAAAMLLGACSPSESVENGDNLATEVGLVGETTYIDTYETTGSIAALHRATVSWTIPGTVADVLVAPGDMVSEGDLLMVMDSGDSPTSITNAEKEIENAQTALELITAPDPARVVTANRTLANAFTSWRQSIIDLTTQLNRYTWSGDNSLFNAWSSTNTALTDAMNALPLANASLEMQMAFQAAHAAALRQASMAEAETALAAAPGDPSLQRRAVDVASALQKAQDDAAARLAVLSEEEQVLLQDLIEALVLYEEAVGDFAASLKGDTAFEYGVRVNSLMTAYQEAGVRLGSAIFDVYSLVRQPDTEAYAAAVERLADAEDNLAELLADRESALVLTASLDGQVLNVNFEPGDAANIQAPAVEIINRKALYIALSVDETRVIRMKVGDPVDISIEVLPDVKLQGQVAYINPVGTASAGVVYYQVRVEIDQPEMDLLIGATANLSVQLSEPRQVIVVPVYAVQNDAGGEFVYRIVNGGYERVQVISGLILSDNTVVVEGALTPGESVALFTNATSTSSGLGGIRIPGMGGVGR